MKKIQQEEKFIYADEFDKIWDDFIQNAIENYSSKYKINYKSFLKSRIGKEYFKQRDIFINSFMKDKNPHIDRHKIASCIVKSILTVKPFYIPFKQKIQLLFTKKNIHKILHIDLDYKKINQYIYYINEYFALSVATSIINGYIKIDNRKQIKHKIILPDPFSKDDPDYLLDVCIDLHFNKLNKINIVTLANIFFLWEKYSCRRTQCNNYKEFYIDFLTQYFPNAKSDEITEIVSQIKYGNVTPSKLIEKMNQKGEINLTKEQ